MSTSSVGAIAFAESVRTFGSTSDGQPNASLGLMLATTVGRAIDPSARPRPISTAALPVFFRHIASAGPPSRKWPYPSRRSTCGTGASLSGFPQRSRLRKVDLSTRPPEVHPILPSQHSRQHHRLYLAFGVPCLGKYIKCMLAERRRREKWIHVLNLLRDLVLGGSRPFLAGYPLLHSPLVRLGRCPDTA